MPTESMLELTTQITCALTERLRQMNIHSVMLAQHAHDTGDAIAELLRKADAQEDASR